MPTKSHICTYKWVFHMFSTFPHFIHKVSHIFGAVIHIFEALFHMFSTFFTEFSTFFWSFPHFTNIHICAYIHKITNICIYKWIFSLYKSVKIELKNTKKGLKSPIFKIFLLLKNTVFNYKVFLLFRFQSFKTFR